MFNTMVIVILLIFVAIYFNILPHIPHTGSSPEDLELTQIKRKIVLLENTTYNGDTALGLCWSSLHSAACIPLPFLFVGALIALFGDGLDTETRLGVFGLFAANLAFVLYMPYAKRNLALLRNRAEMLEEFLSAKHSGKHDETALSALKTVLEHQLKCRNKETLEEIDNLPYYSLDK